MTRCWPVVWWMRWQRGSVADMWITRTNSPHALGDAPIGGTVEKVERVPLSAGTDGTDQTIVVMSKASMSQYGAGSALIRNLAIQIVRDAGVPERDKAGEIVAIHAWVKQHLRYVKDPLWYEFVTYPETLAFERADGDCDDHVVLEAALLGALGIPSRFVVYAFKNSTQFAHVAMQAMIGDNQWMSLDPIVKNQPAGWEVPDATKRKVYGINTPDGPQGGVGIGQWIGILAGLALLWGMLAKTLQRMERKP